MQCDINILPFNILQAKCLDTQRLQKYLHALFGQCYFMLNNWLPKGRQICQYLELKLYSQFEESFISCLK